MNLLGYHNNAKEKTKKSLYTVEKIIKKNHYKVVGITTSTLTDNEITSVANILVNYLKVKGYKCQVAGDGIDLIEDGINVLCIESLGVYAEAIEKACNCECVLFVEKYGTTKYKLFEECLEVISNNNIKILGILNLI